MGYSVRWGAPVGCAYPEALERSCSDRPGVTQGGGSPALEELDAPGGRLGAEEALVGPVALADALRVCVCGVGGWVGGRWLAWARR